jgi:hypothetical protein
MDRWDIGWSARRIPHGSLSQFSRPEPLHYFQVAPHLSLQGLSGPVPDPLLLRKSGSAGDQTRDHCVCSQELDQLTTEADRTFDIRGGRLNDRCPL